MKTITQKREGDKIHFYMDGSVVAALFDGQDKIIFDELAYGPALLDETMPSDFVEQTFREIGLGVFEARYIDACPDLSYPNK